MPTVRTVELETPIQVGDKPAVTSLQIRKPVTGDLRGGISLAKLQMFDVDDLSRLLPRIATPLLDPDEIASIELPDLDTIFDVVTDFLLTKARRDAVAAMRKQLSQSM
ncbi:phage tail assembly protein [Sphingomonas sp. PR090111-T3T-6A]|uniref:phage tail assembly protein n=1 Tax=Sphingomonas sp. PR090111-T3T-6A TaxID=685778 RepID=UPI00035F8167|nr:phage tail assembly protein [Sphingomonas sp. PR090111-T3T-6A]